MIDNHSEIFLRLRRLKGNDKLNSIQYTCALRVFRSLNYGHQVITSKRFDLKRIEEICKIKFVMSGQHIVGIDLADDAPPNKKMLYLLTANQTENTTRAQIAATLCDSVMAKQYMEPLTENSSALEIAISYILNKIVNDPTHMSAVVSNICNLFSSDHIRGICEPAVVVELLADFERPIYQYTYTLLKKHGIYQAPNGEMTIVPLDSMVFSLNYERYVNDLPDYMKFQFMYQFTEMVKASNTHEKIYKLLVQIYLNGLEHWRAMGRSNKIVDLFPDNSIIRTFARRAQSCAYTKYVRNIKAHLAPDDTYIETCQTTL